MAGGGHVDHRSTSPTARVVEQLDVPRRPSGRARTCCFGGDDLRTLFAVDAGTPGTCTAGPTCRPRARLPALARPGRLRKRLTIPCSQGLTGTFPAWRRWRKRSRPRTRTPAPTTPTCWRGTPARPVPAPRPQGHFLVRFWRSAVGKKWVMAVSGIILLGFVLAHMIGNLKVFLGEEHLNDYGEWLRDARRAGAPAHGPAVGAAHRCSSRAFVVHIVAAYQLTRMNHEGPAGEVPVAARLRRRQLRVAHDALDRHHRRPLRHLPPARPHVGAGEPATSCAATCTTTSSTASSACRSRSSTSSRTSRSASTSSTARGACSRASGSTTRAGTSGGATSPIGVRGRHHRRQRQHAVAHRDRGGDQMIGELDAKIPDGPDRGEVGRSTSST